MRSARRAHRSLRERRRTPSGNGHDHRHQRRDHAPVRDLERRTDVGTGVDRQHDRDREDADDRRTDRHRDAQGKVRTCEIGEEIRRSAAGGRPHDDESDGDRRGEIENPGDREGRRRHPDELAREADREGSGFGEHLGETFSGERGAHPEHQEQEKGSASPDWTAERVKRVPLRWRAGSLPRPSRLRSSRRCVGGPRASIGRCPGRGENSLRIRRDARATGDCGAPTAVYAEPSRRGFSIVVRTAST